MDRWTIRAAWRRLVALWLWYCAALFLGASTIAAAQPLACSAGAASTSGLYESGSGLLSALSLGSGGVAVAGSVDFASSIGGGGGGGGGGDTAQASCPPAEPASLAAQGPSTLAGNPVDVVTGVKLDRAIDAYLPSPSGGALDDAAELVFSRFYASDSAGAAALGPGWRLGLDVRLYASVSDGRRLLQIVQGDGRRIAFGSRRSTRDGALRHDALSREDGVLEQQPGGQGTPDYRWIWHWRNGRRLFFDTVGRLRRIESHAGSPLALDYDSLGRLSAVRSAAGRAVYLRYHVVGNADETNDLTVTGKGLGPYPGRLAALTGSEGDLVRYDYDRVGRLARVSYVDGARVGYEYADAHSRRLVAVVLPDGRRSAYRYLPDGRVVYSRAAGDGEAQALHFDYRIDPSAAASGRSSGQALGEPGGGARGGETADAIAGSSGVTTLRTDGRVRATYRWTRAHAGSPARLLSAVGPGCARCPLTGRHYRYDHAGRVVEIRAGTTSGSDAAGPTLVIRRDPDGRPLELRWGSGADRRVRIAWRDEPLLDVPAGIDRPSVVPGLRASLEPVRDTRGRVVAIEETGYAPTLDDKGKPDPKAAIRLRRVSASPSAAMSVPRMPEAPMSGDAQARLWRDDFGRAVALRSPDFGLVRRRFDDSNRLEFERRADGSTAHYRYDADGRLIEYRETSPPRSDDTPPTRSDDTPPDAPANTPANTPANAAPQASSRAHGAITRFHWSQGRLTRVENEDQNEWLATDADGRVVGRHIALRLESGRVVEFDTHFEYDAAGRLRAWSLPGGGWIRARADSAGQTVSLEWQPTETAFSLPLLSALERDRFGLRRAVFGNGVAATLRRAAGGRLAEISHRSTRGVGRGQDIVRHGFVFDGDGRLRAWRRGPDLRTYLYDAQGRLLQASQRSQSADRTWRFAYDVNGNRLLAQRDATRVQPSPRQSTERFEKIAPGNRLRRMPFQQAPSSEAAMRPGAGGQANQANHMQRAPATWDAAGRLIADAGRSYRWDAGGHLREVREAGRSVARYRYDARGLRIAKLVDGVATHYLYDPQRRLLAELDAHGEILRQYVYLADRPVAILDRAQVSPGRPAPAGVPRRIRYLHLNHLGAPEAVTDERARVIWRADYAPFGRRLDARPEGTSNREAPLGQAPHFGSDPHVRPQSAFELALRLPGQYEDRETGLHYNDHRYYDPDTGRYLSPDPLGLAGGPNPYVYAGNDPLTRVDPSGLLLFAFDGTGNGDPPARSDDWSNVYKLSRAYADGRVWYMAGVGRDDPASGILTNATDAIVAGTATARVDYLLTELEAAVSAPSARGAPVDVDVIGFSRGAAMARDFSNRVADRISRGTFGRLGACVRLRFLGLWDTVAQFGPDGLANIGWRLSVPVETAYAAQAVALNEHRTLFPAESIAGSPLAGVRIERGFVGAHSDVGGSYAEGDLSDVALIWMHEQARLAGAHMFALTSEYARVTAPLLHDSNTDGVGDREFRYRNSWGWVFANPMQRVARVDGLQWRDTGQFISRLATPGQDVYGEPTIAGSVDMRSYSEWLMANYAIDVEWEP